MILMVEAARCTLRHRVSYLALTIFSLATLFIPNLQAQSCVDGATAVISRLAELYYRVELGITC